MSLVGGDQNPTDRNVETGKNAGFLSPGQIRVPTEHDEESDLEDEGRAATGGQFQEQLARLTSPESPGGVVAKTKLNESPLVPLADYAGLKKERGGRSTMSLRATAATGKIEANTETKKREVETMNLQEEIVELNRLVVAKDRQLADLHSELTTRKQAHIDDRKKAIAKDAQLDALLEKLRSHQYCENKIRAMETKLDESRRHQTALETAADNQTKLYHDLEDERARLKARAEADLKRFREEVEAEGKRKSDHVEVLEVELKDLRGQVTELSTETDARQRRILQLLMELSNASDNLEGFRKDKQDMAEAAKNLSNTLETATRQCSLFVVSTDTDPTSNSNKTGGSTAAERSRVANATGSALDSPDLQNGHETASHPTAARSRSPGHTTILALAALIIAAIDGLRLSQRFSEGYGFYSHGGFGGLQQVFIVRSWWAAGVFIWAISCLASSLTGEGMPVWESRRRSITPSRQRI